MKMKLLISLLLVGLAWWSDAEKAFWLPNHNLVLRKDKPLWQQILNTAIFLCTNSEIWPAPSSREREDFIP